MHTLTHFLHHHWVALTSAEDASEPQVSKPEVLKPECASGSPGRPLGLLTQTAVHPTPHPTPSCQASNQKGQRQDLYF